MALQSVAGYSGSARRILHFRAARGGDNADSERHDHTNGNPHRGHVDEVSGDGEADNEDDESDDVGSK